MFDYLLRASAAVNDLSFTHLHEPPHPNTGIPCLYLADHRDAAGKTASQLFHSEQLFDCII